MLLLIHEQGTYAVGFGATNCTQCPPGFECLNKTNCPPGNVAKWGVCNEPTACEVGFGSLLGEGTCSPCSAGTYAAIDPLTGAAAGCVECEDGYYQTAEKSPNCEPCPPGYNCTGTYCPEHCVRRVLHVTVMLPRFVRIPHSLRQRGDGHFGRVPWKDRV